VANDDKKIFVIQELVTFGGVGDTPLRFEWDAKHQSSPRHGWEIELLQRTQREDYPQSDRPSEQVLGSKYNDQEFSGVWDNRYNPKADGTSFAEAMDTNLTALVERGNLVRISFERVQFVGLITKFKSNYKREYQREYHITFSPHYRVEGGGSGRGRVLTPYTNDPTNALLQMNDLEDQVNQLHQNAPLVYVSQDFAAAVISSKDIIDSKVENLNAIFQNQTIQIQGQGVNSLSRAVAGFQAVQNAAADILPVLAAGDVDTDIAFPNAIIGLGFETWTRELGATYRQMIVLAARAAADLGSFVGPKAIALYRPHAGESLYGISQKFYGTPFAWQTIAMRNNLFDFTLTGLELLVIPSAP